MNRWEVPLPTSATYPSLPQYMYPPQPQTIDLNRPGVSPLSLNSIVSNFKSVSTLPIGSFGAKPTTTILCTTPASVLPPPPPSIFCSPTLPHVFVSDHSESPPASNVNAPTFERLSPHNEVNLPPSISRTDEPASHSSRAGEPLTELSETKRTQENKNNPSRYLTSYQSSSPINNHWLKRLVVAIVVSLVVGLIVKIGIELWRASYEAEEMQSKL